MTILLQMSGSGVTNVSKTSKTLFQKNYRENQTLQKNKQIYIYHYVIIIQFYISIFVLFLIKQFYLLLN